jgi:hypothetical protein
MRPVILASLLLTALTAAPALAQDCPAAVPFEPEDRLADLSARCGVPASAILRANDAASETDLRQAGAVAIPQAAAETDPGLLERARNAADSTAERAEGVATRAGEAAADYLSENHVGRDLLELGQSTGLLAADDAASEEAQLSAVASGSDSVRLAATGLPGAQAVTLALVKGNGTMPLHEMMSESDGTLLATISRPDAATGGDMVFALEADGRRLATASLQ